MKTRSLSLIALLILILSAAAFTGCATDGMQEDTTQAQQALINARMDRFFERIEATPEQREKLSALKDELLLEVEPLQLSELKEDVKQTLQQELLSTAPNRKRIHTLIDDAAVDLTTLVHALTDKAQGAHGVLTDEQRETLAERLQPRERRWEMVPVALEFGLARINATDAQRALVEQRQGPLVDEAKTLVEKFDAARVIIREELRSKSPNIDRIHTLIDENSTAMTAFAHSATDALLDFHATLTDEQREMLASRIKEHQARHHH